MLWKGCVESQVARPQTHTYIIITTMYLVHTSRVHPAQSLRRLGAHSARGVCGEGPLGLSRSVPPLAV